MTFDPLAYLEEEETAVEAAPTFDPEAYLLEEPEPAQTQPPMETIGGQEKLPSAFQAYNAAQQEQPTETPMFEAERPTEFTQRGEGFVEEKIPEETNVLKTRVLGSEDEFEQSKILQKATPQQFEEIVSKLPAQQQSKVRQRSSELAERSKGAATTGQILGAGAEAIGRAFAPNPFNKHNANRVNDYRKKVGLPKVESFEKWIDQYRTDGNVDLKHPELKKFLKDINVPGDQNEIKNMLSAGKWYEENKGTRKKFEKKSKEFLKPVNEIFDPTDWKINDLEVRVEALKNEGSASAAALERGDLSFIIDQAVADIAISGTEEDYNKIIQFKKDYEKGARDPKRDKGNWLKQQWLGVMEMAVPMTKTGAKMAIPGIGKVWGGYEWAKQGMGEIVSQLTEEGVPLKDARDIAAIGGIAYAAVEQLQFKQITNIPKATVKKVLIDKGADWAKQVAEEGLQRVISDMSVEIGKHETGVSDEEWNSVFGEVALNALNEMKEAAPKMLLISGPSTAAGVASAKFEGKEKPLAEAPLVEEPVVEPPPVTPEPDFKPDEYLKEEKKIEEPTTDQPTIEEEVLTPEEIQEIETGLEAEEVAEEVPVAEKRKIKRRTLESVVEEEINEWVKEDLITQEEINDPKIRKMAESAADKTARNEVTGLPSKAHKHSAIDQIYKEKTEDEEVVTISMDQDYFKPFNDSFDHATGDDVLTQSMVPTNQLFESIGLKHFHESGDENFAIGRIKKSEMGAFVKKLDQVKQAMEDTEIILPNGKSVPMSMTLALSNDPAKSDNLLSKIKENVGRNSLGVDKDLQKKYNIKERQGPDVKQKYIDAGLTGRGLESEQKQAKIKEVSKLQTDVQVQGQRGDESGRAVEGRLPESAKTERAEVTPKAEIPAKKPTQKSIEAVKGLPKEGQKTTFKDKVPDDIKKQISPEVWEKTDIGFSKPEGGVKSIKRGDDRGSIAVKDGRFKVTLNPNLNGAQVAEVLFHELGGHAGAINVLKSNKKIHKRLSYIYKTQQNTKLVKTIRELYKDEATPKNNDTVFSEWIASSVENHLANPKKRGAAYQVWKAIKEFFINLGIPIDSVDDAINTLVKETKKIKGVDADLIVKPMKAKEIVKNVFEKAPGGKYYGYKVMAIDENGQLRSGANSRLRFNNKTGEQIKMSGDGVFVSNKSDYVIDYYSDLAENEALLKVEFDLEDISFGRSQLADKEPEIGLRKATIVETINAKDYKKPLKSKKLSEESGDLFAGTNLEKDEDKTRKAAEKTEVKLRQEQSKGGRADVTDLPMFEGKEIEGTEQMKLFSKAFYSPTARTISELKQEKGVVPQIKSMIKKGQLKKAEVEWMGLEEFLEENPKASKQEVLDFVRANEVTIEESELGADEDGWAVFDGDETQYFETEAKAKEYAKEMDFNLTPENYDDIIYPANYRTDESTKYSQYTLPGGENYRELLLKMPDDGEKRRKEVNDRYGDLSQRVKEKHTKPNTVERNIFNLYDYRDQEKLTKEEAQELENIDSIAAAKETYKSSHWDKPNVFAHTRINDRTTPEGDKVLFIEEIQSDWAREVREKGAKRTQGLQNEYDSLIKKQEKISDKKDRTKSDQEELDKIGDRLNEIDDSDKYQGVPDFPFKKNWQEFVLKRLLREAAEKDYDRIAWVTGEQTADRYDLSKQVGSVKFFKFKDSSRNSLFIYDKNEQQISHQEGVSEEKVADYIGKEPAKRLLENETLRRGDDAKYEIEGENLKIGGGWAINLYDKMIPKFLGKYAKKWGAKVEETDVGIQKEKPEAVNTMAGTYEVEYAGNIKDFNTKKEAEAYAETIKPERIKQLSLPITDEMKESVMQGQPLFSKKLTKETADLDHVQKLNKETRSLQAKVRFISPELALERANMGLKIKDLKDESADMVRGMVYDYAKKIHLRGEPYNRVDTLIKNSKTAKNYQKAVEIMDDVLQRREKNILNRKVAATIKKEKERLKRLTGKGKSNQDLAANKRLAEYIEDLEDISPRKLDKMEETVKYFQDNPDKELPESIKKDVLLATKTNVREMDSRQLLRILQDIKHIKKQGKLKSELLKAQRDRYLEKYAGNTAKKVRDTTKKSGKSLLKQAADKGRGGKTKRFIEAIGNLSSKYGWSHIRPERILDWFTSFEKSGLQSQVFDKALKAEETQLKNTEEVFKVFKEINKDIDMAKTMNKPYMKVIDSNGEEVKLALNGMMHIYANSQNPGNRAHLNGTEIDDNTINLVADNLPDKHKKVVDATIDYFDEVQHGRVNEPFQREHNVDMPKEHRYFPIMNLNTDRAETTVMNDLMARYSARQGTVQKGNTKSRVKSKSPYDRLDFYGTVTKNIQQSEHYIAYNDAIREINEFLNNKELKAAMENKSKEATAQIKDWVKAIAYGKIGASDQIIDKISDVLRNRYMTSVLGLNPITMMKQPASFAQGMKQVGPINAIGSAGKFVTNPPKMVKLVNEKSVMMRNRATSYERELAEIAEKGFMKKQLKAQTAFEKTKEFSMKGITIADKATTTILWYAKYHDVLNKIGSEDIAVKEADRVIRRTQPMGGLLHLPKIYRSGGIARAYTMFTNQLNQNLNLMFELQQTWGQKSNKDKIAEVAFYTIIPSALIYMASHGGRLPTEDPEGWARAFVSNITGGLMIANKLIDSAMLLATGKIKEKRGGFNDTKSSVGYAADLTPASMGVMEEAGEAIGYGKADMAIGAFAKFTGIPYTSGRRTVRGIKMFKETKDPRYLIWSKFALKSPAIKKQMVKKLNKKALTFKEKQRVYEYLSRQNDLTEIHNEIPDLNEKVKKLRESLFKISAKDYNKKFQDKPKEADNFEKWKLQVGRI